MILKLVKRGEEFSEETFSYVENCENVNVHKIALDKLLEAYQTYYKVEKKTNSIYSFAEERVKCYREQHPKEDFISDCVIAKELASTIGKIFYIKEDIIGNLDELIRFSGILIGDESCDSVWLHSTYLKCVSFTKRDNASSIEFIGYTLFSIYSDIYILDDNGKTIDKIK